MDILTEGSVVTSSRCRAVVAIGVGSLQSSVLFSMLTKAVGAVLYPVLKEQNLNSDIPSIAGCFMEERFVSSPRVPPMHAGCLAWGSALPGCRKSMGQATGSFSQFSPMPLVLCSLHVPHNAGNCQDL